jgi:hypothetical protein
MGPYIPWSLSPLSPGCLGPWALGPRAPGPLGGQEAIDSQGHAFSKKHYKAIIRLFVFVGSSLNPASAI